MHVSSSNTSPKATPKYYNEFIYLYSSIYLVMHKKHPRNLPEKQKCDL